jgi:hypothetical protein
LSEENGIWWSPTERSVERLRILPNVSDKHSPIPTAEGVLDRPHQAGPDAATAVPGINDQFAQVCPESEIVGAHETKNLTVVFPHKCQPVRGLYCVSNRLL